MSKQIKLEQITSYKKGFELSTIVWDLVSSWDYFAKDTVGKQFVRSVDSVTANISEGFGRYHFKDSIKFYYFARGSVYESQFWCKKSYERNLISRKNRDVILKTLRDLPKDINILIKLTRNNQKIINN